MKFNILVVIFFFITSSLYSQNSRYSPLSVNSSKTKTIGNEISSLVSDAVILNVDNIVINSIVSKKEEAIVLNIPLHNTTGLNISLKKFEVLIPGAKTVAGTDKGDVELNMKSKVVSYTGRIPGDNNSLISVTFSDDFLMGVIVSENETYILGKLNNNNQKDYILYQASKLKVRKDFKCGSDALGIPEEISRMQQSISPNKKDYSTTNLLKLNIAIESDYETFIWYGGVENAQRYLLSLFATVSALYVKELNIQMFASYIRVWTTSADPYSGTTSNDLLNQFRSYWNANMQAVPRTLAHYITRRPGNLGGIAWLNSLCASTSNGYGYAFSNIDGTFNSLPVYSWDVMVVSHESGHNFGSPHTHSCNWPGGPIDSCYAVEGGCYNGPVIARLGTIMSYCHLTSGGIALNFGPLPGNLIRAGAENAPCISIVNGLLFSMPNGGEIFRSGNTPLIIWGASTTNNINIEYSLNNGSTWTSIQNNVPVSQRNIVWTVPYIPSVTQAKVRIYETGNPSITDMSDSVFQIRPSINNFNAISPPQFSSYIVNSGDTSKLNFYWHKAGTLPEFKYRLRIATIGNTITYSRFSNNNGSDTAASVSFSTIDSIMAAWNVLPGDSLRVRWSAMCYTTYDSSRSLTNFDITFVRSLTGISYISNEIPKDFQLKQNYPNPFNPATNIEFSVPKSSFVALKVYDIMGREVKNLVNNVMLPGTYKVDFGANNLSSGVYYYRINMNELVSSKSFTDTRTMILLK